MRKFQTSIYAILLLVGILLPTVAQPSKDWQPLPLLKSAPKVQEEAQAQSWRVLPVQNVSPKLMAWWLDPRSNVAPPGMNSARVATANSPYSVQNAGYSKATDGVFELPAGVEIVLSAHPRSELLIFGTEAGFRELEKIATFLDQPLRRVEVEAYYVEVSREDAGAFNLTNAEVLGQPASKTPSLSFVRADFQAVLSKLAAAGKARVLGSPRLKTNNNQQVSDNSLDAKIIDVKLEALPPAMRGGKAILATPSRLAVTPSINNDNSITLLIDVAKWLRLRSLTNSSGINLGSMVRVSPVCNIRPNNFIALTGDEVQALVPGEPLPQMQDTPQSGRNVILFVTAREINDKDEN